MGFESERGDQNKKRRNGRIAGAMLLGAIAAGSPAHGQEATEADYGDLTDTSDYPYVYEEPSEEVMNVLGVLDNEIGDALSITQNQVAKIQAAVDAFVAKHPATEGKTRTEGRQTYTDASYSPYLKLENALWTGPNKNPLVMGVVLAYIKTKVADPATAKRK
jgi:hypothetical protein